MHYALPSLSSCFRHNELFKYEEFNKKYNTSALLNYTDRLASYQNGLILHKMVTIDDILNFTPRVDEIIDSCEIRNS